MLFLDENPSICASSTPISLYVHILSSIKRGYEALSSGNSPLKRGLKPTYEDTLEELIKQDMMYCKKSRDWVAAYFNSMSDLYHKLTGESFGTISPRYMPKTHLDLFLSRPLTLHSPLMDTYYRSITEEKFDTYNTIDDVLTLSRAILVDMEPTADEFPFGAPEWFKELQGTDYVVFDQSTRKYLRILKTNGRLRYFTATISNNWTEIKDVPEEIDTIVNYLISLKSINLD